MFILKISLIRWYKFCTVTYRPQYQIDKLKCISFFIALFIKKKLSWLNQCNINWLSSLKLNTMPQFLGCFVKCFHFVWSKLISACQKCLSEGASIAVPTWCAVIMAKVGIGIATRWRVVDNVNVMASTESRSIIIAVVYGVGIVITIPPCLRQFHRRPSWLVNQREKECLGIISILAAVTCWENKKWKGWSMNRLRSKIRIHTDKKRYWYY